MLLAAAAAFAADSTSGILAGRIEAGSHGEVNPGIAIADVEGSVDVAVVFAPFRSTEPAVRAWRFAAGGDLPMTIGQERRQAKANEEAISPPEGADDASPAPGRRKLDAAALLPAVVKLDLGGEERRGDQFHVEFGFGTMLNLAAAWGATPDRAFAGLLGTLRSRAWYPSGTHAVGRGSILLVPGVAGGGWLGDLFFARGHAVAEVDPFAQSAVLRSGFHLGTTLVPVDVPLGATLSGDYLHPVDGAAPSWQAQLTVGYAVD